MRNPAAKLISSTNPSLHISHPTPPIFTWNTIIRAAYAAVSPPPPVSPLSIYTKMLRHGVRPDLYTFPALLPSLSTASILAAAHAHAFLFGLTSHPFTCTTFISMYSTFQCLSDARRLFDEAPHNDLPSWNSLLSAYIRSGFLEDARQMFDEMPSRNVVTWTAMIDGLAKSGGHVEALDLFRCMMKKSDVRPNEFTFSSVIGACTNLGALEHGKWVHFYLEKMKVYVNNVLGTSLIDMYAKCGSIDRAIQVFVDLDSNAKDVMAWSAMMSGLAVHGRANDCVDMFDRMVNEAKLEPNAVTFLAVLSACVHGGLVDNGKKYFERMKIEFGIEPEIQHYGCIVDLFARAGRLDEAWHVVNSMPLKPDVQIWGALLSGSRTHADIDTCELAIKELIELEPSNSAAYVLLSNLYAKLGRWDGLQYIRGLIEDLNIKKSPGCSTVEIDGRIHEFFVGDTSHNESREIYMMLEEMMVKMKLSGYVCDTTEVLLDLEEDEGMELALSVHSEKLAVAFALIKTSPHTTIRIIKNIRICTDCHNAMKFISNMYARKIIVRDCTRFHHFQDGSCSCSDFW